MPTNIWLIVPCYNEAARLDFEQFTALPAGVGCLLVDDGSRDATLELVRRHQSEALRVLALPRNVGKAEAIRQGVLHAQTSGLLDRAEWFGYWDADLATPFSELENFLRYAALEEGRVDGVLGSRIQKLGSRITRSYRRHLFGRGFATLASMLLGLDCYDSQCGAKIFRTELARPAFAEPFLSRWIFDVEVLVRLRDRRLIECPLHRWRDVGGSKIRIVSAAAPVLFDLLRIRRRYGGSGARIPHRRAEGRQPESDR
jgi:dolichyl-phosphate beta-glucosyltransferase